MSKPKIKRVWLKGPKGEFYRIFSVANPVDHKGEYYLKIMFPDLSQRTMLGANHDAEGDITHYDESTNKFQEFTYHYLGGVSHYKNSKKRIDHKRQLPTLRDFPVAHVLRLTIFRLTPFIPRSPSAMGADDIVIQSVFDPRFPRLFEIIVTAASDIRPLAKDGVLLVRTYKLGLEDKNACVIISEAVTFRPSIWPTSPYEIYRYDDPVEAFEHIPGTATTSYGEIHHG